MNSAARPAFRPYQYEDDYWRLRAFLREVYPTNFDGSGQQQGSWHVARLDYARWHVCLNCDHVTLEDVALIWEVDGSIAALAMPDGGPGEVHIAVHPRWRTPELEDEIVRVAEERIAASTDRTGKTLTVWVHVQDRLRQQIVAARGYARAAGAGHHWRIWLDGRDGTAPNAVAGAPAVAPPIAAGYTVRSLGDGLELLERCYASGLGFHKGDIKIAVENRDDVTWYRNIQNAPLYRRDLDLVAVAPDGAIAAFCTVWFDDVTRSGYFEPLATVPAHRQRGLARALMTEALRRLRRLGAVTAEIGGYNEAANALYGSIMGGTSQLYEPWSRDW
jgi:mycothiol synthase